MTNMDKIQIILDKVKNHQKFVLLSHIHTDGDALGSLIALYHALIAQDKEVHILVPGEIPDKYSFLNTESLVNQLKDAQAQTAIAEAEVIFILDISGLHRLEKYNPWVKAAAGYKIIVDHHPVQQEWCDLALVDAQRIATAEMVYDLFSVGKWPVTQPIAEALYTGIVSDSGSFRFFKTDARTFRMASELVEKGVEPSLMYSRVFEVARIGQLRAWGELLAGLNQKGNCTWLSISKSFMLKHNLQLHEIDGIIDIMRRENTSQVFLVFVEKEPKEILVGLRSKGDFNVGIIARKFGGGGHFHASGYTSEQGLQQTIQQTLKAVEQANKEEVK